MILPSAIYALVSFLSAFLLFQVQPLVARAILPWFGGAAAVWLACLMFFQVALLAGYAYAHALMTWTPAAARRWIHLGLLVAACFFLPILPDAGWKTSGPQSPVLRIVALLASTIGLPFLILAATSPLVQAWYARRRGDEPYRFFAVSNAGSLLGLLSYPLLVEPFLSTRQQGAVWSAGFVLFGLLIVLLLFRGGEEREGGAASEVDTSVAPNRSARLLWVALPACACGLLLAVTNHLTQNVAAFPFLWVLPLSLYLLSFVLTFGRRSWYHRGFWMRTLAVALGAMAYGLSADVVNAPLLVLIPVYASGLFACCMFCHGELARLKPPPVQLTSYYLMISLGGALGGLYVSGFAPLLYSAYFELHVLLGICALLGMLVLRADPRSRFYQARWQPAWLVLWALVLLLAGSLYWTVQETRNGPRVMVRSFYGALRVVEETASPRIIQIGAHVQAQPESFPQRKLIHGAIVHGVQSFDPTRQRTTTTYYVARSGVALAIREANQSGPVRVGLVGLGIGTLAALGVTGDVYRFYEINPQVVEIARKEFTYLSDSTAKIEIAIGDGRLMLESELPQNFDVIALDAFSGDAIPVHLLTREAFELYFRHLKPGGVLAVHVSNRYVDLKPVVQNLATVLRKKSILIESTASSAGDFQAFWVLVSDRKEVFEDLEIRTLGRPVPSRANFRTWADDYSNLLQLLK